MKTKVVQTICYFDINQRNGGSKFAKNMDSYLNTTDIYESKTSYNQSFKKSSKTTATSHTSQKVAINTQIFEFFKHILRVDTNAVRLFIRMILKRERIDGDILLFHDIISLFYFRVFFYKNRKRTILILHNDGNPSKMITSNLKYNINKKVLGWWIDYQMKMVQKKQLDIVFLCEKANNTFLIKYPYNHPNSTFSIIPNGIEYKPNTNNKRTNTTTNLITVCTLNKRKGIDYLIDLIPALYNKYENQLIFTIIGEGSYKEELEKLSVTYPNVKVLGKRDDIDNQLINADVFFLLSRMEGQPLSILEALRASLPIIATNVACNNTMVINKYNGILTDINYESILSSFEEMINNKSKFAIYGKNSLDLFEKHYTQEVMFRKYHDLFERITN